MLAVDTFVGLFAAQTVARAPLNTMQLSKILLVGKGACGVGIGTAAFLPLTLIEVGIAALVVQRFWTQSSNTKRSG